MNMFTKLLETLGNNFWLIIILCLEVILAVWLPCFARGKKKNRAAEPDGHSVQDVLMRDLSKQDDEVLKKLKYLRRIFGKFHALLLPTLGQTLRLPAFQYLDRGSLWALLCQAAEFDTGSAACEIHRAAFRQHLPKFQGGESAFFCRSDECAAPR